MPLELKKGSGYWYGRVQVHGKRTLISLHVPVQGKRPPSLSESGDAAFEMSRAVAQAKLDETEKQLRERGNEQAIVERLLFLKQGVSFEAVKLTNMFSSWVALSPGKRRSPRYLAQVKSLCAKFAEFAAKRVPAAVEMAQVSQVLAGDFISLVESTGVTAIERDVYETVCDLAVEFADQHSLPVGFLDVIPQRLVSSSVVAALEHWTNARPGKLTDDGDDGYEITRPSVDLIGTRRTNPDLETERMDQPTRKGFFQ